MKTFTKKTLVKLLAASFCVTAAAGTAVIIDSVRNSGNDSPFKGIYGGNFAAFAESGETESVQVGNLTMKKMMSQDGNYILLATSISDVTAYKGIGYYITENGVSTSTSGNTYYTGIQVRTGESTSKTYSMQDIFGAEYSYENAGMIVYEAEYTANAEYEIAPYLVTNDDSTVRGSVGYIAGTNENVLTNGSFETGDLTGWTLSNQELGAVNDASTYWDDGVSFDKSGNYLFNAYADGALESATGTLVSSTFTVGGTGWMTFKLGAAKNDAQVYVEVVESGSNTVLARYGNTDWQDEGDVRGCTLMKYKADLTDFNGKQVYIRITDNATSDYGLFFADEFITYYEEVPADGTLAENILYRGTANKVGNQVVNGGFETGDLTGWTLSDSENPIGYVSSQDCYWNDADKLYNKEGSYLFTGLEDAGSASLESNTGTLVSSPFTVGGSGWMTFKWAGGNADIHISVLGADDTELMRFRQSVESGTMTLYKADLSSLSGQEVRIAIYDNSTSGWGCIAVDSFITYYENADAVPADAAETLNLIADKTDLSELVTTCSQITAQGDYTDGSYEAFTTALSAAQTLLNAEEATAVQISECISDLQTAYENLTARVPEVNSAAPTQLDLFIEKSTTFNASDYFDTKGLGSITYTVTSTGIDAVLGEDENTVTVTAGSEACSASVTVNALYKGEVKATVVINVTVTEQVAPTVKNVNVEYSKDVYYETDKTGFEINLAENVSNPGELALTYSVSVGEGANETVTVTGDKCFFNYGSYSTTEKEVTLTVTVQYTANGVSGSVEYTVTLKLKDSTADFTFTTSGIYAEDGVFSDF